VARRFSWSRVASRCIHCDRTSPAALDRSWLACASQGQWGDVGCRALGLSQQARRCIEAAAEHRDVVLLWRGKASAVSRLLIVRFADTFAILTVAAIAAVLLIGRHKGRRCLFLWRWLRVHGGLDASEAAGAGTERSANLDLAGTLRLPVRTSPHDVHKQSVPPPGHCMLKLCA